MLKLLDWHRSYIDDEGYYYNHGKLMESLALIQRRGLVFTVHPDQCLLIYFHTVSTR